MRRAAILLVVFAAAMAIAMPVSAKGAVENRNHPSFWEAKYPELNLDCYKVGGDYDGAVKIRSDGHYGLVIVKGGPAQRKTWDVEPGDWIKAPWNRNSWKKYEISYVIYCNGDRPS